MGSQAYNSQHVKQVKLALNLKTDADIIRYLATIPNIQGYIKTLIREDMTKGDSTMTKEFEKRILREGIVDTAKYRYTTKETDEGLVIVRIPIDKLDTTAALTDWEIVK